MLRHFAQQLTSLLRNAVPQFPRVLQARFAHGPPETEEAFNNRYIKLFKKWDVDDWEVRQAMNDLCGMDLVPHPTVVEAGFIACRTLNDIALAIRWMEAVKNKCGAESPIIYPYLMRHLRPVMKNLGIPTIDELGFDKPQLALKSVYDM